MCSETVTKALLVAFNIVFLLTGLATAGMGVWVLIMKAEFENLLGSSLVVMAAYIAIGGGGIVAFMSLAGCAGALMESQKLLTLYIVCLVLVFFVEAAAAVVGFIYYDEIHEILDENVKSAILNKYGYNEYKAVSLGINELQIHLQCCGFSEPADWSESAYYTDTETVSERGTSKVPVSCCKDMQLFGCNDNIDDKLHSEGCVPKLEQLLQEKLIIVSSIALSLAMIQFFGIVLSLVLLEKSKENEMDF